MAIHFGNDKIKDIYYGSEQIKEVYYGSEKVWGGIEAIPGYWVHKDTNAVTYFGADADFITGGIMSRPPWYRDCSEVKIPLGVTGLGNSCFKSCSSLTSINIPESVTSIDRQAFAGCSSLPSIILPEGVTSLGIRCFQYCSSLILATVLPAIPPSLGSIAFYNVHSSLNIKVRSPYVNAYKTATNWNQYASKISAI